MKPTPDNTPEPLPSLPLAAGSAAGRTKKESCLIPELSHLCTWPKCVMRADGWHRCVPECPTDHTPSSPNSAAQPTAPVVRDNPNSSE